MRSTPADPTGSDGPRRRARLRSCVRTVWLALTGTFVTGCWGGPPSTIGVRLDALADCPPTPNCVHTGLRHPEGTSGMFLRAGTPITDLIPQLTDIVESMPRTTIVSETERYVHAVVRSRLFRFPDDLELYVGPDLELIVRSASRVGRSDLGVNAERVEDLRRLLGEAGLLR